MAWQGLTKSINIGFATMVIKIKSKVLVQPNIRRKDQTQSVHGSSSGQGTVGTVSPQIHPLHG